MRGKVTPVDREHDAAREVTGFDGVELGTRCGRFRAVAIKATLVLTTANAMTPMFRPATAPPLSEAVRRALPAQCPPKGAPSFVQPPVNRQAASKRPKRAEASLSDRARGANDGVVSRGWWKLVEAA
jgi:hypothetical protein